MFEPEKLRPGMYLKLFHGFESDEARNEAQEWGEQGPTIGPLLWSHQTYNAHITLGIDPDNFDKAFLKDKKDFEVVEQDVLWLNIKDDCIHFNGMFYGDWEFVHVK